MIQVTIRVQAKGGMFLGPDSFNGAFITLKEKSAGKLLRSGYTDNGDSGTRMKTYQPMSSTSVIVTPDTHDTVHWVTAADTTAKYTVDVPIAEPTLIEFTANVPLPAAQGDQQVSITQWISPDHDPSVGPGLILVVPGLWVQPEVAVENNKVKIRAKVTMMCGCEVNINEAWIPSDFQVDAIISNKSEKKKVSLKFIENSQFAADCMLDENGNYKMEIIGYQKSTGNTGVGRTSFTIK